MIGQSSNNGSPLSRSIFDTLTGTSPSLKGTSPSLKSDENENSQRCISPTFGSPSVPTVADADDELSGAASLNNPSRSLSPSLSKEIDNQDTSHSNLQYPGTNSSVSTFDAVPAQSLSSTPRNDKVVQLTSTKLSSPKSPAFGTDEVEDSSPTEPLSKTDSPQKPSQSLVKLQGTKTQPSVPQDELALCSAADEVAVVEECEFLTPNLNSKEVFIFVMHVSYVFILLQLVQSIPHFEIPFYWIFVLIFQVVTFRYPRRPVLFLLIRTNQKL